MAWRSGQRKIKQLPEPCWLSIMIFFSVEPGELSCTEVAKHEIGVTEDEPFKERFQRIPPLMVEEVCTHMKEIMEDRYYLP